MVIELSDAQVDKARHALGLARKKEAYRNYYASSGEDADWNDLVARGFAIRAEHGAGSILAGYIYYSLTRQAAFYFLNQGETIPPDLKFTTIHNRNPGE